MDRASRPPGNIWLITHASHGGPAWSSSAADPNPGRRETNLAMLREHFTAAQVSALLMDCDVGATQTGLRPTAMQGLLDRSDINAWREFFVGGLGLTDNAFFKLLRYSPGALSSVSPFAAGQAIMILRRLGFSDTDLFDRLLPIYPQLLSLTENQKDEALELLAPWAECDGCSTPLQSGADAAVSRMADGGPWENESMAVGSAACSSIIGNASGSGGASAGGRGSMGGSGSVSVADLVRQCPAFLIPEVYRPLGVIINRIRASREGK